MLAATMLAATATASPSPATPAPASTLIVIPIPTPRPLQPAVTPSPEATISALPEIGHVKVTACGQIVNHANVAISHVFRNDHTPADTIKGFRELDFNTPDTRSTSIRELLQYAASLRDDSARGAAEVKVLRSLESSVSDPGQQQNVAAFADSLSGILARQRSAASHIDRFIAYYGYHDPTEALAEDAAPITAPTPIGAGGALPHADELAQGSMIPTPGPQALGDLPFDPNTPDLEALTHADDLVKLGTQINDDEAVAGERSAAVMSHC
ncbi:MAG TPA: hypothetical protein VGD50_07045 [Candidatus Baltobacteraceae bacterium]